MTEHDTPLYVQIDRIERQIVLHRRAASRSMKRFNKHIRDGLGLPAMFLATAGLGLAIGALTKRRIQGTANPVSKKEGVTPVGKIAHILGDVLKVIAMVRTLAATLPRDMSSRTEPNSDLKS